MAGSTKKTDQTTVASKSEARRIRRVDIQQVQNVLLIWLDGGIDENDDDYNNSITQLRSAVNNVYTYTGGEECIHFIQTVNDNKVCMIVSGALGQHIVPRVHDLSQVDSIFVFCGNQKRHEEWAKKWPKIKGVFTQITPICEALKLAAQQCEHNSTPMSFVASDRRTDQLDPSFMYTQILKEILSTIDFDQTHIKEYADYCRDAFADNSKELEKIDTLEEEYRERRPIWWYTDDCFLYPMLNLALRMMDGDVMTRMGFFINDLHRDIEQLHKEQYADYSSAQVFTAYRGQGLSKTDFQQLTQSNGGLMSFNNFLSTSTKRNVSLRFAREAISNPDLVGVLFVMKIDPAQSTTPFASISQISAFKNEAEVLFAMHSVFRIHKIEPMSDDKQLHEVHLSLTSDSDKELRAVTDHILQESCPYAEGWYRLALVLTKMGQLPKAEEIYESLLTEATSESEKAHIAGQLGLIKDHRGEHQEALAFHQNALTIQQQSLPANHPDLAASYINIGAVYNSMGDYKEALLSFEKALVIQQQSLPANHLDLAASYNNIGNVYDSMGDYPRALSSFEKALAIKSQSLPSSHFNLAVSHNNIGNVYGNMGNYSKALTCFEKALSIQQQSLPPTHLDLARSCNNIGSVYENMGNYSKACSFYERAVQIDKQSLPTNHPMFEKHRNKLADVKKKL